MRVWNSLDEWRERRRAIIGHSIGFVPTMGALHGGHASLVSRCREENEITVVSIFVNPSQFNDPSDLERYPRVLDRDLELLENLGTDDVLVPRVQEMYPHGYRFRIEAESFAKIMEAAHRPGFLQGVMTVVLKLLNLVRADRAYFGEKDYQQLRTVADLVQEFFIPTEIVACPTTREPFGLAESSRNTLLSAAGKEKASSLFRALTTAANPDEARALLEAQGFRVDYVEEHWGRRLAAAYLEGVRLIDNVSMSEIDVHASLS
jgi:pantoate--beta-alanine ligase